jgi:Tfp pilus assembly protein PilE
MSASYTDIQPQRRSRKGLAIASLVLGVVSIPTLGLFVVGAITALAFGIIALNRVKKEPAIYGGKGMAIAGIITSAVSLVLVAVFAILAFVAMPRLLEGMEIARESAAIEHLRTIHYSQARFYGAKQRFGTLKELNETGYLDSRYVNGNPVDGYIYTSAAEVTQDTYCVQATRQAPSTASRDFNVTEDGAIRFIQSKNPSPVPHGEGTSLAAAGAQ